MEQQLKQLDRLEEELKQLTETTSKDEFTDWLDDPVTQILLLDIQTKSLEKSLFLANGSYIDEERGLLKAARAEGARMAFDDLLAIHWNSDKEDTDEG